MDVTVLGLGYIGLPTALLLADAGVSVTGYDIDEKKIKTLSDGKLFFEENGLEALFSSVLEKNTFFPKTELQQSDVYIICVPTPTNVGSADLTYVLNAIEKIGSFLGDDSLVIIESTVGPHDCEKVLLPKIREFSSQCHFALCTERAIPGNTIHEMIHNDRVIGGIDDISCEKAKELYSTFIKGDVYTTDPTTAAICKVMENTYRAVNIALANQFAKLAKIYEIDVWEAIELCNNHPRVNIHSPGPGVGGHCIPIDPYFMLDGTENSSLIKKSLEVNESMPNYICKEVIALIKKHGLENPKIGVLGYAYKKNVDDTRETPVLEILQELKKQFEVKVYDPFVNDDFIEPLEKVLGFCDVLIIATDHDVFKKLSFDNYEKIAFVYDSRNVLESKTNSLASIPVYTLGKEKT